MKASEPTERSETNWPEIFTGKSFADVRLHRIDDNITRERFAEFVNKRLSEILAAAPTVYPIIYQGYLSSVRISKRSVSHKAKLIFIEPIESEKRTGD